MGEKVRGFKLIIAEKPSVARDIARVLKIKGKGRGFIGHGIVRITWCVGHLVELAEPHYYNPSWKSWRLESLPIIPQSFKLIPRKDGQDQWHCVQNLLNNQELTEVINACDAGREGELIFAYIYELAHCSAPVRRLWISSMTDESIRKGFASLRPGEQMANLEAAARARSEADWIVGINATRAMTLRMQSQTNSALLSLGRVQTPTLSLLHEREKTIEEFEPQPFWMIKVTFGRENREAEKDQQWQATWNKIEKDKKRKERFDTEEEAKKVIARIKDKNGKVSKVERRKKKEKPPLLYDLTTLQKEANKRFRFSAQHTLEVAQSLYEKHKVLTYPRTDSRHIGSDQVAGLPKLFNCLDFAPYQEAVEKIQEKWPFKPGKRVVDDKEVSDHHAIIPTGKKPQLRALNIDEQRLFELVARRFLAVFMDDAIFATALVETKIEKELFVARGRTLLDPGWQAIDPPVSVSTKKEGEKKKKKKKTEPRLPPVEKGETAINLHHEMPEGKTKPPPRYTEATLLGAMERAGEDLDEAELKRAMKRKGLGTPATRASIIETLLNRKYIERKQKGQIVPTEQGRALLRALPVEALKSPRMTGEWEARLAAIAEGEETQSTFMSDIRQFISLGIEQLIRAHIDQSVKWENPFHEKPTGEKVGDCPLCTGEVRESRRGWCCTGCALRIPTTIAQRKIDPLLLQSLLKERKTELVKGFKSRVGKEFQAELKLDDLGKVVFSFPASDELGKCPQCGKPVRSLKNVYTCDSGRDCPFIVSHEMLGRKIPKEILSELLVHQKTRVLEGFRSATDPEQNFSGYLLWKNQRIRIVSPGSQHDEEPKSPGRCPSCNSLIIFRNRNWSCQSCSFQIPAHIARRDIRFHEVSDLLTKNRTQRLYGFRQKSGAVFRAALVFDEEKKVQLDFTKDKDEVPKPIPRGGPPPAFGERVDCPLCLSQARLDPGYIIAGRKAWGCSLWKQGCTFQVPFEVFEVSIPAEEAKRLFSSKKATRFLKEPIGPVGKRKICRIVLHPQEDPCWTIEPKKATRRK